MGGFAPLHYSIGLLHQSSVAITHLLLSALADPDVRATDDDSYINRFLVGLHVTKITRVKDTTVIVCLFITAEKMIKLIEDFWHVFNCYILVCFCQLI